MVAVPIERRVGERADDVETVDVELEVDNGKGRVAWSKVCAGRIPESEGMSSGRGGGSSGDGSSSYPDATAAEPNTIPPAGAGGARSARVEGMLQEMWGGSDRRAR